jgi:sulfide:quinone oxidoreductase
VALPQLSGPSTPGVPGGSPGDFIPIDTYCKVRGLERVYVAGDATDFAVKHGGIAAQQADTAVPSVAAIAGASVTPKPLDPEIQAILIGGDGRLYMTMHLTGGHGPSSQIGEEPTWSPPTKIAARYLAPYLESPDRVLGASSDETPSPDERQQSRRTRPGRAAPTFGADGRWQAQRSLR